MICAATEAADLLELAKQVDSGIPEIIRCAIEGFKSRAFLNEILDIENSARFFVVALFLHSRYQNAGFTARRDIGTASLRVGTIRWRDFGLASAKPVGPPR